MCVHQSSNGCGKSENLCKSHSNLFNCKYCYVHVVTYSLEFFQKSNRSQCYTASKAVLIVMILTRQYHRRDDSDSNIWAISWIPLLPDTGEADIILYCVSSYRPWTMWASWRVRCLCRSRSCTGALTPPPCLGASTSLWCSSLTAPLSAPPSTSVSARWECFGRARKWYNWHISDSFIQPHLGCSKSTGKCNVAVKPRVTWGVLSCRWT